MKKLSVTTFSHDYPIYIGEGLRFKIQYYLSQKYTHIFIVTDDVIARLYLDDVLKGLDNRNVHSFQVPAGETSKSIDMFYKLQTELLNHHLDRKSLIIALGGGVVGDLAGFVAATYMRGIDYVQVPTTILAHDSSVGGKVAINHELGKNMIGNFYAPKAVIYDVETLQSLPQAEIRSGYAELIKEAYIANEAFLQQLLTLNLSLISTERLKAHLFAGIKVKANIVERDERESSIRKFLNFGHTLAHALETELGYGKVTHGEAVAIGMLFALHVSEAQCDQTLYSEQLYAWLRKNQYPLHLFNANIDSLIAHMKHDKKVTDQGIQMVLLKHVGSPEVVQLTENQIRYALVDFEKGLNSK